VIFDLEGVLIDNNERLKHALRKVGARSIDELKYPRKAKFWKIFLDRDLAYRLDKVNDYGLKILAEKSTKYKIVIVSGSLCSIVRDHIEKIKNRAQELGLEIRIDEIFCRRGTKRKSADFKESIVKRLLVEDEIVEIHDDDESVIKRVKKYGIRGILWQNLRPAGS